MKPLTRAQAGARPAITLQKFKSRGVESFRFQPQFQPPATTTSTPSSHPGALRGTAGTHARAAARAQAVKNKALRRLAGKLIWKFVRPRALEILSELGRPIVHQFWQKNIDPTGFPGWGNFPAGFTSDAGTVWPGIALGDYTANGFDNGPWSAVVVNLIDTSDGAPIPGFRYWGHFPGTTPLPNGRPGDDWEVKNFAKAMTKPSGRTKLRDLSPDLKAQPWHPRQNIVIEFGTALRDPITVRFDKPRVRLKENKIKPANKYVWLVLKKFADAGGELKEWTDILADASGYIEGSMMIPEEIRYGQETKAKLYWLFNVTGLNSIDWNELAMLILENEFEDAVYGFMGQLSKSAAQNLGMTVGPQTGLVM